MSVSQIPWLEDEASFLRELARGRRAEFQLAIEMLSEGLSVRVGELEPRDGPATAGVLGDQVDIEVNGRDIIEVKARGFAFSSPDDYPYPDAFVGSTRRWTYRAAPPCAVVLMSEPTGGKVVASLKQRDQWITTTRFDTHRDFYEESWSCPKALLHPWPRFLMWLKR